MTPTIETVKEKLQTAYDEIDDLLTLSEQNAVELDDDTHDELIEVLEIVGGFLGNDGAEIPA